MTDPKRHFQKPVPLLTTGPDRPRALHPLLPLRALQPGGRRGRAAAATPARRGSYVGTFDSRPHIAPFHGNIIELCPVGALTSEAYRFRARPWDIEDAGLDLHALPLSVQREIHRARREGGARPRTGQRRGRRRLALRQGALRLPRCSTPRIGSPLRCVRRGGVLGQVSWDEALDTVASGLRATGLKTAVLVGKPGLERGGYSFSGRSPGARSLRTSTRAPARARSETVRALSALSSARPCRTSTARIGPAGRRRPAARDADPRPALAQGHARRANARVVIASERPTALDGGAEETVRYALGGAATFLAGLAAELGSGPARRRSGPRRRRTSSSGSRASCARARPW